MKRTAKRSIEIVRNTIAENKVNIFVFCYGFIEGLYLHLLNKSIFKGNKKAQMVNTLYGTTIIILIGTIIGIFDAISKMDMVVKKSPSIEEVEDDINEDD